MSEIWITVTKQARDLLRSEAIAEFHETGRERPDGRWEIPLRRATYDRLTEFALPDETFSDAIIRLIATQNRQRRH